MSLSCFSIDREEAARKRKLKGYRLLGWRELRRSHGVSDRSLVLKRVMEKERKINKKIKAVAVSINFCLSCHNLGLGGVFDSGR